MAEGVGETITIGLVNNMPDAALRTTERQFSELLAAASGGRSVALTVYALPEVPRSDAARAHIREHYDPIESLLSRRVDGLIVTGTQPRARDLADEPYWASLAKLVDWAEENTKATLWSCLAAHAAVLHLDGIERQPYPDKLSGVYICATSAQHPFAAGFPSRWHVPHSRYNGLPEDALRASGYRLLSRSNRVGADLFIKQRKSLFVFFQGHPEYDAGALLREYRADIVKFLGGERATYPGMPHNYFDRTMRAALAAFRERAEAARSPDLLASLPIGGAVDHRAQPWRRPAVRVYRNWLDYLAERKAAGATPMRVVGEPAFRDPCCERPASALPSGG
jgi:homoserine O-succinyltransferase